jgi:hypothetical protein
MVLLRKLVQIVVPHLPGLIIKHNNNSNENN